MPVVETAMGSVSLRVGEITIRRRDVVHGIFLHLTLTDDEIRAVRLLLEAQSGGCEQRKPKKQEVA